ncbi:MAG: hypothetical protein CSA11_05195 [Chloroflexi bacterium]|nr:MAG: hypothetical protein CSA11_05195 [Chloroflexota bacterium]
MYELQQSQFESTRTLFTPLCHHLAVESILAGLTSGRIFVDDVERPRTAVAWFKRRVFLAGNRTNARVNVALNRLFTDVYYPEMQAEGFAQSSFTLVYTPGWERAMDVVLAGKDPMRSQWLCYRLDPSEKEWRVRIPKQFRLRWADAALLADSSLTNLDDVTHEMLTERPSIEDFLQKSFGTCVLLTNEIVGWCLTEYNLNTRCELGIATMPHVQGKGLATATASATMREAARRGYTEIGCLCTGDNEPSQSLVRKLGFSLFRTDDTYYAFFNPMLNQGVNGNVQMHEGNFQEAVMWYEQALVHDEPPIWLLWNASMAWANLGNQTKTFAYLNQLVDAGFEDRGLLQSAEHFRIYHRTSDWASLLSRI